MRSHDTDPMPTPGTPPPRRAARPLNRSLVLAAVLHGLVYFLLLPAWMGEDEPWHFEYVRDLTQSQELSVEDDSPAPADLQLSPSQQQIQERTGASPEFVLRTQREIADSMRREHFWRRVDFAGWEHGAVDLNHFVRDHTEAGQPPFYYATSAALLRMLRIDSVDAQLWFLRFLSLLAYLALIFITLELAWLATADEWVAVVAAVFVAILPMHARQAAMVNNDVLVKVFSSAALLCGARVVIGRGARLSVAAMAIFALLAIMTKPTAIGLVVPICFAIVVLTCRGRSLLVSLAVGSLTALTLAALAVLYWNSNSSGSLPDLSDPAHHLAWVSSPKFYRQLLSTFVGTFNWQMRRLPTEVYSAAGIALGIGLLGSVFALLRGADGQRRKILALCWLAFLSQLFAMGLRGYATGRYLFPVLPALATLLAIGWLVPLRSSWRPRGTAVLISVLIVFDGYAIWNGLVRHQYMVWGS